MCFSVRQCRDVIGRCRQGRLTLLEPVSCQNGGGACLIKTKAILYLLMGLFQKEGTKHEQKEVNFVVMQFTHVSGHNKAESKKNLSLDKTVLLMWSQI